MSRKSNISRGDTRKYKALSVEYIVPLVRDLRGRCFECINFVFGLRPSTQIFFLFDNCSSFLKELLPEIAGTFWLDAVVPDWRTKTEITDRIMQSHVQYIMNDVIKLHHFKALVSRSEKLLRGWESQYESLENHEFYDSLHALRKYHIQIHAKMTAIFTAMEPRNESIIGHLRKMQETGRRPRTQNVEMLLDRLMQI
jgi:hypothetical protein